MKKPPFCSFEFVVILIITVLDGFFYFFIELTLKLLLDGDVEFIKHNNKFQFSEQTIYRIKYFINDIKKDKEYKCYFSDLGELIKNKKNGENIQLDYEYNSFEDFFIPYIHQIIASLYEIKIDDNVYIDEQNDNDIKNMHLACTYELLTHSVYNKLKEKFLAFKAKLEKSPEDFVIVSDKSMKDTVNIIDSSISALENNKEIYNKKLVGYDISLLNQYKKDLCNIEHQEYDEKWYNKK